MLVNLPSPKEIRRACQNWLIEDLFEKVHYGRLGICTDFSDYSVGEACELSYDDGKCLAGTTAYEVVVCGGSEKEVLKSIAQSLTHIVQEMEGHKIDALLLIAGRSSEDLKGANKVLLHDAKVVNVWA